MSNDPADGQATPVEDLPKPGDGTQPEPTGPEADADDTPDRQPDS